MAGDAREPLERGGADVHRLDGGAGGAPAMDQGIERGVGERPAEDFQALLAAAHPGQPVVDEGHPQAGQAGARGRAHRGCKADADAGLHAGLLARGSLRCASARRPGRAGEP